MSWREWFPWPIGTHWCRFETVLCWIALPVMALNVLGIIIGLIIMVFW
jgi:hypothetical protein